MDNLTMIETELQNRNKIYFEKYIYMKTEVADKYNEEIRIIQPWFTNHGIKHCQAIIKTLDEMIYPISAMKNDVRNEKRDLPDKEIILKDVDLFILLASVLWHDIGMIIDRKEHGNHLVKFTSEIMKFVNDKGVAQSIYNVACAHSSNKKFYQCKNNELYKFYDARVSVAEKTLASMLRIADEVSEDRSRVDVSKIVFDQVPEENKLFWEHGAAISYSSIENNQIRIQYSLCIDNVFVEYISSITEDGIKEKCTLYEYVIKRICKILNEIIICGPYFSHICRIDSLDIRLKFEEQQEHMCTNLVYEISEQVRPFINIDGIEQIKLFYKNYIPFNPDGIKEKIKGV